VIFALSTDDRTLSVFATAAEAIGYCEGIDVEDGVWLFFANDGTPLKPTFTSPNRRGVILVGSGTYILEPASVGVHLCDALKGVAAVEGSGMSSVDDVRRHLNCGGTSRGAVVA